MIRGLRFSPFLLALAACGGEYDPSVRPCDTGFAFGASIEEEKAYLRLLEEQTSVPGNESPEVTLNCRYSDPDGNCIYHQEGNQTFINVGGSLDPDGEIVSAGLVSPSAFELEEIINCQMGVASLVSGEDLYCGRYHMGFALEDDQGSLGLRFFLLDVDNGNEVPKEATRLDF